MDAKARKDSSTSSKPPSSDIVKKPKGKGSGKRGGKRKPGAQKGHPQQERPPFTPDEIDDAWEYRLYKCPKCGGKLEESDCFSAYRKDMGELNLQVQFCLAHLIRDVKYLTALSDKPTNACGERLLDTIRELFRAFHRRDELTQRTLDRRVVAVREKLIAQVAKRVPDFREARNMAKRFCDHGNSFLQFTTTPDVEKRSKATNSLLCVLRVLCGSPLLDNRRERLPRT